MATPTDPKPAERSAINAAQLVLDLLRGADRATLATLIADAQPVAAGGWPYASLVLIATDADGAPLMLLSDLAEHTRNLARDPRASLLLDGTAGLENPLTGPRATLIGRARPTTDKTALERFLARHPAAQLYAQFRDFRCYRLELERAHLVAGFGRIEWVAGERLRALAAQQR